jgi:hypothetical protein
LLLACRNRQARTATPADALLSCNDAGRIEMTSKSALCGASLAALLLLAACGSNTEERAATGGLSGAAAGAVVGGPVGAVVGGAVGAGAGTAVEKGLDEEGEETTE